MLKQARGNRETGDTLIEVLFAVTVFSLVIVTTLTLMNQGVSASMRSLQITLVRQEIDSQAETLRFLNSAYVAAYQSGYAPTTTSPAQQYFLISTQTRSDRVGGRTSVSQFGGTTCQTPPAGSFILNARTARYNVLTAANTAVPTNFSQVEYNTAGTLTQARGIWIEAVRSADTAPASATAYTDFHIRACWYPPGSGQALNLGTIVRLYEPIN